MVAIYAISLAGWFAFFYAIWGTPLPMAPYGSLVQTTPLNLRFGAPGLLFDQEYGLLAYAPVYILAATGLYQMWRAGAELRRQAIEITFIFAALLATVGAFGIWWGGTSAPARPIASGLPLLMLPIAMAFRSAPAGSPRRAAQHLLLWIGVGIAITLAVGQDGLLINNARDGTSALLDFWSPRWELWSLAPTFIADRWILAWLNTAWWLVVATLAAVLLAQDAQHPSRGVGAVRVRDLRGGAVDHRDHHPAAADRAADAGDRSRRARRASPRSTDLIRARGPRRWSTIRSARAPRPTRCRN